MSRYVSEKWVSGLALLALFSTSCVRATPPTTGNSQTPIPSTATPELVKGAIEVDGTGAASSLLQATVEGFKLEHPQAQINIGLSGTESGFKKLCAGAIDLVSAARPVTVPETESCRRAGIELVTWPIAVEKLVVVVNAKNTWLNCLTISQLQRVWGPSAEGQLQNWRQLDPSFPNLPLKLYGPGPDSTAFSHFTSSINGKEGSSRSDYQPQENGDSLVRAVAATPEALAYVDASQVEVAGLRIVPTYSEDGCQTSASPALAPEAPTDPLARTLRIYVNQRSLYAKSQVKAFVDYYLSRRKL
ncbi:substrate-binding domain-containing protein [Leptolyngbya sp. FACHB-261]|uniref:substrate-binding domain-containing protein n=1 Tax=Leptolyngbya sp. FACHB-261 TaxID=2692806 RepID=UPI0016856B29|nr:substrate-binding domain-containing protein [Leptolyngbya sp. FACHB-261]MBD2101286.1 substrate-binding domain-containing protein [Leptolyngbya sp. FACHB-261]